MIMFIDLKFIVLNLTDGFFELHLEIHLTSDSTHVLLSKNLHHFTLLNRKYALCRYILVVLIHTTAWDLHLGGDETLN